MKLSILFPVYNERYLVAESLRRVLAAPLPAGVDCEVVIVDDGSTDGTSPILERMAAENAGRVRLLRHEKNRGKGAAVRTAIAAAQGDILLIQDADLEYDPADYPALLAPMLAGKADVVYGSRFSGESRRVLMFWHSLGNRALTFLSNMFTGLSLTDMWCCYKAVLAPYVKHLPMRCNGFSLEPELTAKLAKQRCRIWEVPVTYNGRGYDEGKKIGLRDAIESLGVMIFFWLVDDLYGDDQVGRRFLHELDKAHRFNGWMADAVKPFLGARVLEIGAGIGNLSARLCARDAYYATDPDPLYRMHLERRFDKRPAVKVIGLDVTRAGDFDPLRGQVDTIVCLNVLEHIPDDASALRNMAATLAPGGRLILLVPNLPSAFGSIDQVAGHLRRYTRLSLSALLAEAGLEAETVLDFNRVSLPAWLWNGKILRRKSFSRLQLKAFDSLVWLFRVVDRFLPWPGQSLIAVARKRPTSGSAFAADARAAASRSA